MARPSPQTDRVVRLLSLLAERQGEGMRLADVARDLDVHKATCHSMLTTLTAAGWLSRDPATRSYHLGPEVTRIGQVAARGPDHRVEFARSTLRTFARRHLIDGLVFRHEAARSVTVGVARAPGVHGGGDDAHLRLGATIPTRPPFGAAICAWSGPEARTGWLAQVPEDVRRRYGQAFRAAQARGYGVTLRVLSNRRLQELAALVQQDAGEPAAGRLGHLAGELADELLRQPGWFVGRLRPTTTYAVHYIEAPVFDEVGDLDLVLTILPSAPSLTGAEITALGEELSAAAGAVSESVGYRGA